MNVTNNFYRFWVTYNTRTCRIQFHKGFCLNVTARDSWWHGEPLKVSLYRGQEYMKSAYLGGKTNPWIVLRYCSCALRSMISKSHYQLEMNFALSKMIISEPKEYRVSHIEMFLLNWLWQIEIGKPEIVGRWFWHSEIMKFEFFNQFF